MKCKEYDGCRDIVCQLPPEAGLPPYMGARLKRAAYGLNDAPRLWFNRLDKSLRQYGLIPTRADRCCYVLYGKTKQVQFANNEETMEASSSTNKDIYPNQPFPLNQALDMLSDPIATSKAKGRTVEGLVTLHVDDTFMCGTKHFMSTVVENLRKDFQVGSEDVNDIAFVGQRIKWMNKANLPEKGKKMIRVDQELKIEELGEIEYDQSLDSSITLTPDMHKQYRSVLGQINWLQSRTQFQACFAFSRCASQAAAPTIGSIREINKLVRKIRNQEVMLYFWPLKGRLRIVGYPDAAYKNNPDKSSQRGQCIFIAENRQQGKNNAKASLIDYESTKIKQTVLSTTMSELYSFSRCSGTCQFLRALWMDMSGNDIFVNMRTDANNLVTTAKTTHLPEQKETIHMINMLRGQCQSGNIEDLSHVVTTDMMADCLTKDKPHLEDNLVKAVVTGYLPDVDKHPPFRELMKHKHKAYLAIWLIQNLRDAANVVEWFGIPIEASITYLLNNIHYIGT